MIHKFKTDISLVQLLLKHKASTQPQKITVRPVTTVYNSKSKLNAEVKTVSPLHYAVLAQDPAITRAIIEVDPNSISIHLFIVLVYFFL